MIALGIVAVDYCALGILLNDFGTPLMIVVGEESPFDVGYTWLSVPLLLAGYAGVPAIMGAVVALFIEKQMKQSLLQQDQAQKVIEALIEDVDRKGLR
jgi:hypothetical protein